MSNRQKPRTMLAATHDSSDTMANVSVLQPLARPAQTDAYVPGDYRPYDIRRSRSHAGLTASKMAHCPRTSHEADSHTDSLTGRPSTSQCLVHNMSRVALPEGLTKRLGPIEGELPQLASKPLSNSQSSSTT